MKLQLVQRRAEYCSCFNKSQPISTFAEQQFLPGEIKLTTRSCRGTGGVDARGAITKCIHPAIMHFINPNTSPPSRHHLHQTQLLCSWFTRPRLCIRETQTERVITARGCFVFVSANTRKINCNCIWLLCLLFSAQHKSHLNLHTAILHRLDCFTAAFI